MTWCYGPQFSPEIEQDRLPRVVIGGYIVRGREGPFDTLSWEGYREGYDDGRYLATLHAALAAAKAAGQHADLVADIETWLQRVTVDVDLNAWRRGMAERTESLLSP